METAPCGWEQKKDCFRQPEKAKKVTLNGGIRTKEQSDSG